MLTLSELPAAGSRKVIYIQGTSRWRHRLLPRNMRPNSLSQPIAHTTYATPPNFVAIDFETADYGRDSVCALARVGVEPGADVATAVPLTAETASCAATAYRISAHQ